MQSGNSSGAAVGVGSEERRDEIYEDRMLVVIVSTPVRRSRCHSRISVVEKDVISSGAPSVFVHTDESKPLSQVLCLECSMRVRTSMFLVNRIFYALKRLDGELMNIWKRWKDEQRDRYGTVNAPGFALLEHRLSIQPIRRFRDCHRDVQQERIPLAKGLRCALPELESHRDTGKKSRVLSRK